MPCYGGCLALAENGELVGRRPERQPAAAATAAANADSALALDGPRHGATLPSPSASVGLISATMSSSSALIQIVAGAAGTVK